MSVEGVRILGPVVGEHAKILTPEAIKFLALLHRSFEPIRQERLKAREVRQAELDAGKSLDFLASTKHIREDPSWVGAKPSPGLRDRRVEITGPVDRKMVVNALNSNVWTYMADFEGKHAISTNLRPATDKQQTLAPQHGTT